MLLWPTVAVLGFVALSGLVIALGTRSTARYEFERNRVHESRQQSAVAGGTGQRHAGGAPASRPGGDRPGESDPSGGASAQRSRPEPGVAIGVATHPAGRRALERASAWWLVDESGDQPGAPVLAGPFPDRIEADWAALSGGLPASVRAVYGLRRTDGALVRRQSPQEQAWLAQLGRQLDRVAEDWDGLVSDTDELTTLLVEVTAALVEAGLPLHDCAERRTTGSGPAGGVCLTPAPGRGILVSWRQHDRMSLQQVRGAAADTAVQRTMNAAIADVLAQMEFRVTPFGSTGCHLVTAAQRSALTS